MSQNFSEPHVHLERYMLPNTGKKNIDAWSPQISSRRLLPHFTSVAAALNIYVLLLRCWSVLTFTDFLESRRVASPQSKPTFQGKAFFRQALAKLSPNFRKKKTDR